MQLSKKEYQWKETAIMGDKSKVLKPAAKKAKEAPKGTPVKTPDPVKKPDPKPQPKK